MNMFYRTLIVVILTLVTARSTFASDQPSAWIPDGFTVASEKAGALDKYKQNLTLLEAKNDQGFHLKVTREVNLRLSNDQVPNYSASMRAMLGGHPDFEVSECEVFQIEGRYWGRYVATHERRTLIILHTTGDGLVFQVVIQAKHESFEAIRQIADVLVWRFPKKWEEAQPGATDNPDNAQRFREDH